MERVVDLVEIQTIVACDGHKVDNGIAIDRFRRVFRSCLLGKFESAIGEVLQQAERIFDGREDDANGEATSFFFRSDVICLCFFMECLCQSKRDIESNISRRYHHDVVATDHQHIEFKHPGRIAISLHHRKMRSNGRAHGCIDSIINYLCHFPALFYCWQLIQNFAHVIRISVDEAKITVGKSLELVEI